MSTSPGNTKRKIIIGLIVICWLCLLLAFLSCKKSNTTEESTPAQICNTDSITFSGTIKPIIISNCSTESGCHGDGSGNAPFLTYDQLNIQMSTGNFEYRVFVLKDMPIVPLNNCDFLKLKMWYENGHPNN